MSISQQYHFVSMVGESLSATFLPLLGYKEHIGLPSSIFLLQTPEVVDRIPCLTTKIMEVFSDIKIDCINIPSDSSIKNDFSVSSLTDIYVDLEKNCGNLAVNMMGGMKRLSFSPLYSLNLSKHLFLQLTDGSFLVSRFKDDILRTETKPINSKVSVLDLLYLQQVISEPSLTLPTIDIKTLCHNYRVSLPENALYNHVIDGEKIDCLWNSGDNTLSMLFILDSNKSNQLDNSRKILHLSSTKKWLNGLYNKKIFVLDNSDFYIRRYEYESGGKVAAFVLYPDSVQFKDKNKQSLTTIFAPFKLKLSPNISKPNWNLKQKKTLVTSMSRFSSITPLVINSHKCPQVVLIYTPEDQWVNYMAHAIQQKASEFGLEEVFLLETSYNAANCFHHLPKMLHDIAEVNITPGTKPLGTALELWALKNGLPVWFVDLNKGKGLNKIRRIGSETEEKPVVPLNLKNWLELMVNASNIDCGWNKESSDWDDDFNTTFLPFMSKIYNKNLKHKFFSKDISIDGMKLSIGHDGWEFSWSDSNCESVKKKRSFAWEDGFWYEKVVAKAVDALNRLDGNKINFEVAQGVRVYDDNNNLLTDRDVLVVNSNAQVFLISCKTKRNLKDPEDNGFFENARSTAKNLGRFVVPTLCSMTTKEPTIINNVCVFGWTTLCQPEKLLTMFTWAANKLLGLDEEE
jgi:hypothetical protein